MSATAIDENLNIYSPYLIPEGLTKNQKLLDEKKATKQGHRYCPQCYEATKKLIPFVALRNCEDRIDHYVHKANSSPCSGSSAESTKHELAKIEILKYLQSQGKLAAVEMNIKDPELGLMCRPDVTATFLDKKEAHEVQLSPITLEQLDARTQKMVDMGFSKIHWYLGNATYRQSSREYLRSSTLTQCYHLTFEAGGLPTWRPDRGFDTPSVDSRETPYDRVTATSGKDAIPFPEIGAEAYCRTTKTEFVIARRVVNRGQKFLLDKDERRYRLDHCQAHAPAVCKQQPKPSGYRRNSRSGPTATFDSLTVDGFTYWTGFDTVVHLIEITGSRARIRAPGDRARTVEVRELLHPHHKSIEGRFMQNFLVETP